MKEVERKFLIKTLQKLTETNFIPLEKLEVKIAKSIIKELTALTGRES